jgi:glutamate-1-semialdehyde aminotransferase
MARRKDRGLGNSNCHKASWGQYHNHIFREGSGTLAEGGWSVKTETSTVETVFVSAAHSTSDITKTTNAAKRSFTKTSADRREVIRKLE